MSKIKDKDIYPRFEFRISHEEKEWLSQELNNLKQKFSGQGDPPVTKNILLLAALKHGIRYLQEQKRLAGDLQLIPKKDLDV